MTPKTYRVRREDAATGDLPVPGGRSVFRILLDEESVGARNSRCSSMNSIRDSPPRPTSTITRNTDSTY